jgi:hypothetical protein
LKYKVAYSKDWDNLEAMEAPNLVQNNLKAIQLDKLKRCKNVTYVIWAQVGDKCCKEFFDCHKQHKSHTHISKLTERRRMLSSPNNIHEYIF